jgi:hypothetical protein
MKHRKLRIAWSLGWGVVCLALIAMWVRSYYVPLRLLRANIARTEATGVQSNSGRIVAGTFKLPGAVPPDRVVDARLATDQNIATWNQMIAEKQTKLIDQSHKGREWIADQQRQIALIQQAIAQYRAQRAVGMAGPQRIRRGALSVAVPHWFLLLVAATIAAVPWTKWRFSLRTLLIATAVVAVGLGLFVMMLRRS